MSGKIIIASSFTLISRFNFILRTSNEINIIIITTCILRFFFFSIYFDKFTNLSLYLKRLLILIQATTFPKILYRAQIEKIPQDFRFYSRKRNFIRTFPKIVFDYIKNGLKISNFFTPLAARKFSEYQVTLDLSSFPADFVLRLIPWRKSINPSW